VSERGIGVGVVGLGFMGRTHVEAYRAAAKAGIDNRLVAVCDSDPDRRAGRSGPKGNLEAEERTDLLFDPDSLSAYAELDDLLADDAVELVSLCTHTDTHVDLAIRALESGKHVLVEKPVAVELAAVERLAAAAERASTLCMPALCMRFWPGWSWLRRRVAEDTYGAVRSATFQRLSSMPGWARGFYEDRAKSGGALFDLHVHDADFVLACFGPPESVSSAGTIDHVTTHYRFADGPAHVVAEGGWDQDGAFPFRMRYVVAFEDATAEFDSLRKEPLSLARHGACVAEPVEPGTGYDGEVRHLLEAIAGGRTELRASMADAVVHTRMIEAERASLESGAPVAL
jgi:predicted dehydrogenase